MRSRLARASRRRTCTASLDDRQRLLRRAGLGQVSAQVVQRQGEAGSCRSCYPRSRRRISIASTEATGTPPTAQVRQNFARIRPEQP